MSYLQYENSCGRALDEEAETETPLSEEERVSTLLGCDDKGLRGSYNRFQVYTQIGKAGLEAANQKSIADGALFQLMQLAKYQAQYRAGLSNLKVKGIEVNRFVPFYKDEDTLPEINFSDGKGNILLESTGAAFQRHRIIDLVLANSNNQETWVEFKSIQRKSDTQPVIPKTHKFYPWTLSGKGKGSGKTTYHRQFTVDRMALAHSYSWNYFFKESPNNLRDQVSEVIDYRWRFDKFKLKNKTGEVIEENVELGAANENGTIRGYFDEPAKDGGFKAMQEYLRDYSDTDVNNRVKLVSFIEMKDALKAVGSEIIEHAKEELELEE